MGVAFSGEYMKKIPQNQGKSHKYKALRQLAREIRLYKAAWESAKKASVDESMKSVITYFR